MSTLEIRVLSVTDAEGKKQSVDFRDESIPTFEVAGGETGVRPALKNKIHEVLDAKGITGSVSAYAIVGTLGRGNKFEPGKPYPEIEL